MSADPITVDSVNGGGPVDHHETVRPDVPDPEKRRTLRRLAVGMGTAATVTVGGSQVPRFSPVGRAKAAVPLLGIAIAGGLLVASGILTGRYDFGTDDEQTYETLQRLQFWADLVNAAAHRSATHGQLTTFVTDFSDFSEAKFYNQAAVDALTAIEDNDASQQEAVDAAMAGFNEQIANMQEGLIEEFHVYARSFENAVKDIELMSGEDPDEYFLIEPQDSDVGEYHSLSTAGDRIELNYTLADGRTITRETQQYNITYEYNDPTDYTFTAAPTNLPSDTSDASFNLDYVSLAEAPFPFPSENPVDQFRIIRVADWPQSEYDSLPEEEQDEITPPSDEFATANPDVLDIQMYYDTLQNIDTMAGNVEANLEQWVNDIYQDLVDGDLSSSDILTAGMLTEMANEENTFVHAGASMAALGLPSSAQSLELRFTNVMDEDGEPAEALGDLYAHPMPSGGFQVGDTIDPSTLESNFYWAFEDEMSYTQMQNTYGIEPEEGMEEGDTTVVSDMIELEDEFEILTAYEINEDGEAVEVDEITWEQDTTTEPPANYDELQAMNDEMQSLQQEIETLQKELAANDGTELDVGISAPWGDWFDGNGDMVGLAIIGVILLSIGGWVTDLIPFVGGD